MRAVVKPMTPRHRPRGRSLRGLRPRRGLPGTSTRSFWWLTAVIATLGFFGLLMIISSSSVESVRSTAGSPWSFAGSQLQWTVVGLLLAAVAIRIPPTLWRKLAVPAFLASLLPLVIVLVPGISATKNGAARWIPIGPFSLQPSEFVKLTTVLVLAEVLTRRARDVDDWRRSLRPALILLLPVVTLVMIQPNLGTTLIIVTAAAAIITIGGVRLRSLGAVASVGALLALVAVLRTPFRRRRLTAFLDLRNNLSDSGYQSAQAMVGFANGGMFGKGLGRSTVKWGYLPYPYNDYIFAVVAEELGLLGAVALIGLFLAFVCLGFGVALRAADRFTMLLAAGITAWIGGQALLNLAAVTSVVPSTGVPLPFISFGGSAQIVNLVGVAILLAIARHPRPDGTAPPSLSTVPERMGTVA